MREKKCNVNSNYFSVPFWSGFQDFLECLRRGVLFEFIFNLCFYNFFSKSLETEPELGNRTVLESNRVRIKMHFTWTELNLFLYVLYVFICVYKFDLILYVFPRPGVPIVYPLWLSRNAQWSSSITIMKRRGARGQPCFIDLCSWTVRVTLPDTLVRIAARVPRRVDMTKSMKPCSRPIRCIADLILDHRMVS